MSEQPRFTATVRGVRDVTLRGPADLAYWTDRLRPLELEPIASEGAADVMIVAADLRWGIRFRELTISVAARPIPPRTAPGGADPGFFFAQAFNTSRFFSWCERRFFRTPYLSCALTIEVDRPGLRLRLDGEEVFVAEQGAGGNDSASPHEEDWIGPAYFPELRGSGRSSRFMIGKITGSGEIAPFSPERDSLQIDSTPRVPIFSELLDSQFTPRHWLVRRDATHARTKTRRY